MEPMTGPLGLVLVTAVLWWGIRFNSRLKERCHCTACTFRGITGGVVGIFCWMLVLGNRLTWESLIAGAIAVAITLALFFSNRAKSGSFKFHSWHGNTDGEKMESSRARYLLHLRRASFFLQYYRLQNK